MLRGLAGIDVGLHVVVARLGDVLAPVSAEAVAAVAAVSGLAPVTNTPGGGVAPGATTTGWPVSGSTAGTAGRHGGALGRGLRDDVLLRDVGHGAGPRRLRRGRLRNPCDALLRGERGQGGIGYGRVWGGVAPWLSTALCAISLGRARRVAGGGGFGG